MAGLSCDLGEEALVEGRAEEAAHHLGLLALVSGAEDGFAVRCADLGVEQVVAERREQVARDAPATTCSRSSRRRSRSRCG
jgi:hypothetical protein